MAASRSGLTPEAWWDGWTCGSGVLAPVGAGVEKFEGSSEVKIVALEGEMRKRDFSVSRRASLKPGVGQLQCLDHCMDAKASKEGNGVCECWGRDLPRTLAPFPTSIRFSQS